jgi:choline dehydrogenase-like flavoprotein
MEQIPTRDNRVSLGSTKDFYGRPTAEITWRITQTDFAHLAATARRMVTKWNNAHGLPILRASHGDDCDAAKPHDVYHPVGICRMGEDAEAVVDLDLKVHGIANIWIASTAVLPSAGNANPTFTMLCLADALADHLNSRSGVSV